MKQTRGVLASPCVRGRRHQNMAGNGDVPKTGDDRITNPSHLLKPVPMVSKKSPKHSLYTNSTLLPEDKRYASNDRFPERSRRRSHKVDYTYKPRTNCPHRITLPPIHRCGSFLQAHNDIGDDKALPVSRPHRANSWMRPSRQLSCLSSGSSDCNANRNKRKVEFRSDSPQIIGEGNPPRKNRVWTNQSPEGKSSPRTVIKSILKNHRNNKIEMGNRHPDGEADTVRLPNIDRSTYNSAGRLRNSGTRWRGRTRTSPGISFTCSKEFAKVFENLEHENELPDIRRKGSSNLL